MTFAELKTRVVGDAWPLGAPENLTGLLDGYVLSGLIEIQRKIKCYQYRHDDVYDQCRTYWSGGATVLTAPRGNILAVYTVEEINPGEVSWGRPVPYRPVDWSEFKRWQAVWKSRWSSTLYVAPPDAGLPLGFRPADASSDATCGRALTGVYTLEETSRRLYVGPWLQSNEKLVVEWQGIKRAWLDGDLVPEDEDFIRLLRLWIEREYGRKWSSSDLAIREAAWREAIADMMVTCERESRLKGVPVTAEEANAAEWSAFTPEAVEQETATTTEEAVKVIIVGDTGHADANSVIVADAIIAEEPDNVILAGDNKYPPNTALVAMAPYATFTDQNKLRAALGNHDLDDGQLGSDVRALAQNPGNGRYFSFRSGPVTFFVVNSGLNTAGALAEPDGNWEGSRQWGEVAGAVLRDTNLWKVLILHHPPYTSSVNYFPGVSALRWVGSLPVHAVVSGHSHQYERLTVGNRTFLVVGTGGSALYDFRGTPYPGSQTRVKSFGYLRVTADCSSFLAEFVDTDGVVRDTVTFNDTPVVTPPLMALDPYITVQPSSQAVAVGGAVTLSVTATGTIPLSYQWQKNGEDIAGENSTTLVIDTVTEAATYRVLVWNSVGYVLSDSALVLPITGLPGPIETVADVATFVAGSYGSASGIILLLDGNTPPTPGYFTAGGTGTHDGVTEIVDSIGTHFTRVTFT